MPLQSAHPTTASKPAPARAAMPLGERRDSKQEDAFFRTSTVPRSLLREIQADRKR